MMGNSAKLWFLAGAVLILAGLTFVLAGGWERGEYFRILNPLLFGVAFMLRGWKVRQRRALGTAHGIESAG